MIPRNTTIPTRTSQMFSTAMDNQANVEIRVFQGEREFVKDNASLGLFSLTGIQPAPRSTPQIEVTFDIDVNGILSVRALDKGTGSEQEITISNASNLDQKEIDAMVALAAEFAEVDKEKRDITELSNEVDALCYSVDTSLAEPGVPDTLKERARTRIDELRDALERNDYDSVKSDLSILKNIEIMVELAIEFAEFEKKKRDDYFFLESELIMLNEIDAMVTLAAEFGKVDKEKRDITE